MQKLLFYLRLVLVASCFCYAGLAMAGVTLTVQEHSLGKILPGMVDSSSWPSEDYSHVVCKAMQGNKTMIVVDGKPSPAYDWADWKMFSPDGQRIAYQAKLGNKWFVVIDGVPDPVYDDLIKAYPVFSPDSQHVGYMAAQGGKWFVVVDGKPGAAYDGIEKKRSTSARTTSI